MTAGMDIVNYAKTALGTTYIYGGNSMSGGIDCSGLVQQVYRKFGIDVPRVTYDQVNVGAKVGMSELRPGDLIFFDTLAQEGPDHVGIYIGGGQFIHAPKTGDVVKISTLSGYYVDKFYAARRLSGVTGSADGKDSTPTAAALPEQRLDSQELAERYGLSMAFFESDPELKHLLESAVQDQWNTTQWKAMLKNSSWWKNNSETQRQVKILETGDPATYKAQLDATTQMIKMSAVKMGAVLSDPKAVEAAKLAMSSGWSNEHIEKYLGSFIDFTENHTMGGQAGAWSAAIREEAYKNGLSLDDQTVKNYAAYIGRGISTLDATLTQVRQQAAGAFPAFSDRIMAGEKIQDIAQPYIQMYANEMGTPYTGLDAFTPQIKSALNNRGKDNMPSPLSLSDFQAQIRNSSSWRGTPQAVAQVSKVGGDVLRMMGLVS